MSLGRTKPRVLVVEGKDEKRARALPPAPPVTDAFVAWFRQLFEL